MRFMIIVKGEVPGADLVQYHEELRRAGVLLDASASVAGYALIDVKSKEEAFEWARRIPHVQLCEVAS